jgi:hypothetical protein
MLSGIGSSISQPFLAQTSPDSSQLGLQGQAQDGALPFDADAESRKRKGGAEVDVKRVRQRTGMINIYSSEAGTYENHSPS